MLGVMTPGIGEAVRRARARRDMSQTALAKAMQDQGVRWHQQTVVKVETGARDLRAVELIALCSILAASPLALLGMPGGDEEGLAYERGRRDALRDARAALGGIS